MPSNSVTERPAVDSRISNLPPAGEPQPAPPLRLTLVPESDEDALRHMRVVLRGYIRKHGAEVVLRAVQEIAGGAL